MKILEHKLKKESLYFCYSNNLYKFLKEVNNIHPIDEGVHRKTNKIFYVFIKCDLLQEKLTEWQENKKIGKFAIRGDTYG